MVDYFCPTTTTISERYTKLFSAMNPNAIAALTAATPSQGDLLDLLNNAERLNQKEVEQADALLKLWYPASYALRAEHAEAQAWLKAEGLESAE